VLNNEQSEAAVVIPVGNAGIADGASLETLYGGGEVGDVFRGSLKLSVPAMDALILRLN